MKLQDSQAGAHQLPLGMRAHDVDYQSGMDVEDEDVNSSVEDVSQGTAESLVEQSVWVLNRSDDEDESSGQQGDSNDPRHHQDHSELNPQDLQLAQ